MLNTFLDAERSVLYTQVFRGRCTESDTHSETSIFSTFSSPVAPDAMAFSPERLELLACVQSLDARPLLDLARAIVSRRRECNCIHTPSTAV